MKNKIKTSILIIVMVLLITGCNSKNKVMSCRKDFIENANDQTSEEIVVTYNKKRVLKIKSIVTYTINSDLMKFKSDAIEEIAKTYNKVSGIESSFEKLDNETVKVITRIDYEKIKESDIKKVLGKGYDKDTAGIYTTNKLKIEKFEKDYLKGYKCK